MYINIYIYKYRYVYISVYHIHDEKVVRALYVSVCVIKHTGDFPQNLNLEDVKTTLLCETSLNF